MITTNAPQHEAQTSHNQATTAFSIITHYNEQANPQTVNLNINGNNINLKLDTEAEIYNKIHQRP